MFRVGEWNGPSQEQKEILAPTATLETLSKRKKIKRNEEGEWKSVAPKDPDTKYKNGKKYHWCIKHQMWIQRIARWRKGKEDITVMAQNKYKSLVGVGEWNGPTQEEKDSTTGSHARETFQEEED